MLDNTLENKMVYDLKPADVTNSSVGIFTPVPPDRRIQEYIQEEAIDSSFSQQYDGLRDSDIKLNSSDKKQQTTFSQVPPLPLQMMLVNQNRSSIGKAQNKSAGNGKTGSYKSKPQSSGYDLETIKNTDVIFNVQE